MARFDLENPPLGSRLRSRGAQLLVCLVLLVSNASTVLAHSQPGVSGILDEDESGVHLLRLYQGLVQRDGESWRFVCSKTYGGVGQDLAGPLPGEGGAAIAIPNGVMIMKHDGTVTPHPDPEAMQGTITAFARSKDKLYGLRWRDRLLVSDVVEITESTVRVLHTDTQHWSDIAVGEASLVLMVYGGNEIEGLRLSFDGQVMADDKAPLEGVLAASVRVMNDVPYYTVRLQNSSQLGRIEQGAWKSVAMAGNALAGPLVMSDGTVLVALDGVLSTFANDAATPLADATDFVTGLYQLDDHPYACTRTGLRDLSSTGLGAQLFDMSELLSPNECVVPEESRSDCELEWQHLLVELLGANIPVVPTADASEGMCSADGGSRAGAAGAGGSASDASQSTQAATGSAGAAGSAPQNAPMQAASAGSAAANTAETSAQPAGCACGIVPRLQRTAAAPAYILLVAMALILRRGRKYPSN
jgi:hypothetical protein